MAIGEDIISVEGTVIENKTVLNQAVTELIEKYPAITDLSGVN